MPAAKAPTLDLRGDPGIPKMLPKAKDPTARLYDGSMTWETTSDEFGILAVQGALITDL